MSSPINNPIIKPLDKILCHAAGYIYWEEYTFTLHHLPGHTRHAVAVEFEVDGLRFMATGDQYQGKEGLTWNYVYQGGYTTGDYKSGARLYERIGPDIILSGHWQPLRLTPEYLQKIAADAETLDRLYRELLPDSADFGAEGCIVRIRPYQITATAGETISFEVELRNPFPNPEQAQVQVVAPLGWNVNPGIQTLQISGVHWLLFKVTAAGTAVRRARLAMDVTIAGQRFGQQAEALVTILPASATSNPMSNWYGDASLNWKNSTSNFASGGDFFAGDMG